MAINAPPPPPSGNSSTDSDFEANENFKITNEEKLETIPGIHGHSSSTK